MNSLILKSSKDSSSEIELIKAQSCTKLYDSKMKMLKNQYKTRFENLEEKIRVCDSDLIQAQKDFSHINKKGGIAKGDSERSQSRSRVTNTSIIEFCSNANKLSMRLQNKVLRKILQYVDAVDQS